MFALAIHAELIPGAGRGLAAPWPFVADIAPHPRRLGSAGLASDLHLDRGVVREERGTGARQLADMVGQRFQECRRSPDPIGQRRPVQIDLLARVDPGLSVQWKMIAIFADQHMRQQAGTGTPAFDRSAWQRRLRERLAAGAGHARADDFADDEPPRDVVQFLRHVLAKGPQGAAAIGAGLARGQNLGTSLQVVGQRGTAVFPFAGFVVIDLFVALTGVRLLVGRGRGDLGLLLKIQMQLVRTFGFRAEPRLAVTRQLMFQLLDLQRLGPGQIAQLFRHGTQLAGIGGQGSRRLQHGWVYTVSPRAREAYGAGFSDKSPVVSGRHVFCGMRQSMPSRSMASIDGLRLTLPSLAAGQTKRPRSNRLLNRQAPCASHPLTGRALRSNGPRGG